MIPRVYGEGGGVHLTPEVKIRRFIVSPTEAAYAARTAQAFLKSPERYPYVHKVQNKEGVTRDDLVQVGWWNPNDYEDKSTIWSDYRFQLRHQSFVQVAHRLIAFSGGEVPNYVSVYAHPMGELPMHQDFADIKRSIVVVKGLKLVSVSHTLDYESTVNFPVQTGDAYSMQFRDDFLSVEHEILNVEDNNIALYISN